MSNDNDSSHDENSEISEISEVSEKTSVLQSDTFKLRLAEAGQAPPCLVMLVGPAGSIGRQWPIEDTDKVLGRSPQCYIYVDDRSVSKSHAKVILSGGDVSIVDLESTNKTVVNGRLISPLVPHKLTNNDQVKTGNVIFKFLERGNIETVSAAQTFDRALTDSLTEAHNRGAMDAKAPEIFKRSELLGIPFGMIVFDIDHFKRVNDTYGHPAGDYVLAELSRIIREKLIRGNDFFARSGGEEFALLLLGSPMKQCEEIAERIHHTIEEHVFQFENSTIPVTISCGVSMKNDSDTSWKLVYERADKALYQSKQGGRNMVTLYQE